MKTIAHVSDVHFGREEQAVVEGLLADLSAVKPDVVAISGDLTQRARNSQFRKARAFLDALGSPYVVVPGNHDVPLYDVTRRILTPLRRYKRHITTDLAPMHQEDGLAVMGLNTARRAVLKGGRLSLAQIAHIGFRFAKVPKGAFKVVVTHHPFSPPASSPAAPLVGRNRLAAAALAKAGVDLVLGGHFHQGASGDLRDHHSTIERSILFALAGTAVSTRRRGEPNAYNRIRVDGDRVVIEFRGWDGGAFLPMAQVTYMRRDGVWTRTGPKDGP